MECWYYASHKQLDWTHITIMLQAAAVIDYDDVGNSQEIGSYAHK